MKAKNYIKMLLVLLMALVTHSSLKGQDLTKNWVKINEGMWDMKYHDTIGNLVVTATVLKEGTEPALINGKQAISPINIWDLAGDSFVYLKDNWAGDPVNPLMVWPYNETTLYITDGIKLYKGEINLLQKSIDYKKVYEGKSDSFIYGYNKVHGFYKGKNTLYFSGQRDIHLFSTNGDYIKSIKLYDGYIAEINNIVEFNDTVYIGYSYAGGLPDGSGLATLDVSNGHITKKQDPEWQGNMNGCEIAVVDGKFYLRTDAPSYKFLGTLFQYVNGDWKAVIINADIPIKWEKTGETIVGVGENSIDVATGDTLNKVSDGQYYHFDNGQVGTKIGTWQKAVVDQRTYTQFSEDYKTDYYQRHGFMPYIDFIYEINGRVIGFGPSVVAELKDKNTSVKKIKTVPISVYPNPSKDFIHVDNLTKEISYQVTDLSGKTALTGTTMEAIDITSLQPGIYLLSFPNGTFSRFIKE